MAEQDNNTSKACRLAFTNHHRLPLTIRRLRAYLAQGFANDTRTPAEPAWLQQPSTPTQVQVSYSKLCK